MHEWRSQRKPRLTPGLSRIAGGVLVFGRTPLVISCALVALFILLSGCGAASPRFSGAGKSESSETPAAAEQTTQTNFVEEDKKENDVPVDPAVTESIISGARDFTREKNEALSNLESARLMREISKYMGVPYLLGGESGQGLDCSAYTRQVYSAALKKELPRTSRDQFGVGSPVGLDDLKFGDLVFFNTTGESASHVGIYLGDDLFAHASVSFGVTISSLESSYYKKRYEGAKRIVE
ncbi:MAG TPA: C40 family peptidase [Bacteroidota bacterium]